MGESLVVSPTHTPRGILSAHWVWLRDNVRHYLLVFVLQQKLVNGEDYRRAAARITVSKSKFHADTCCVRGSPHMCPLTLTPFSGGLVGKHWRCRRDQRRLSWLTPFGVSAANKLKALNG